MTGKRHRVVFAAGGTGGHLYPAFAIADALRARGDDVAFIGTRDRLEARLVPHAGYAFETISAYPLRRRFSLDVVRTVISNATGVVQSLGLLSRLRPDIVIATGGYVCVPVVVAARVLRLLRPRRMPIALLEPNAVAGVATRLLAPLADEVWGERTTGTPVRAALLQLPSREDAARRLGLDPNRKTLFAFGASQGARSINDAVCALLLDGGVPQGWQVLLLSGEREYERIRESIGERAIVRAYLDDPADAYAVADLVLGRAGASTLAELRAVRVPAILVPYPYASEAHQVANAAAAAERGSAVLVDDAHLARELRGVLAGISEPERLAAMRAAASPPSGDPTAAVVARIDALVPRS